MTRWCSLIVVGAILSLMPAERTMCENRPVELGFDGGFLYSITDSYDVMDMDDEAELAFPVQRVRAGFFVSDPVSIEPALGLSYVDYGSLSVTDFTAALAGLYHFGVDPARPRVYVGLKGTLSVAIWDQESDGQFGVGGMLGVKLPVRSRFAVRLEAGYLRAFESEDRVAARDLWTTIGFSFFTK